MINLSALQSVAIPRFTSELGAENLRLRKELVDARLDIEILGKAAAYFAEVSR